MTFLDPMNEFRTGEQHMWSTVKAQHDIDIARIVDFQRKTDIRYSGFTEEDLNEWISRGNTSLLFFDNGDYQLGISLFYDADKDRYYVTEMGANGDISNQDAFKEIATQLIFFLQTRHTDTCYGTIPINPKLSAVDLYAEVFNEPRFNVEVLVEDPSFQRLRVTIIADPVDAVNPQ